MTQESERSGGTSWLIAVVLACAVLAVYVRTWGSDFDFVNFDDDYYVTANPEVQRGLSWAGVGWAFTTFEAVNWHPLTWLSLQLDAQLFGATAPAMHRTNVLLHVANTVLLFWLLKRLTGAVWPSALVAAIFGLHPAHVEAVAWVTARKDVLSTLFWLLTTAAYAWYAERPGIARYLLVLLLFALGLMAKPMLVTLPATLLLLDYWPLRRWPAESTGSTRYTPASVRWLLGEKVPLFLLVVPAVVLTLLAQKPIIDTLAAYTLYDRFAGALVSYVRYLRLALRPVGLAILYPLPRESIPLWQAGSAGALLTAVTVAVCWAGRTRRYLPVGWFWFLGTLVPVIGLIQNGPQAMADRYSYVPFIGLSLIPVWGLAELCRGEPRARRSVVLLTGAALTACVVLSWQQLGWWRNSEALWRHALAVTTQKERTHANLGGVRLQQGRYREALAHFSTALELDPQSIPTALARADALTRLGDFRAAHEQLMGLLARDPDAPRLHTELGRLYKREGKLTEAVACYDRALQAQPTDPDTWNHKGVALEWLGQLDAAARCYERAVEQQPGLLIYRLNLASVELQRKRDELAYEQLRAAFELQPNWPEIALSEAWTLATHPEAARRDGKLALRTAALVCTATQNQLGQALAVRAAAHAELQQYNEASAWQRKALALLPTTAEPGLRAALTDRLQRYEQQQPYRDTAGAGPP